MMKPIYCLPLLLLGVSGCQTIGRWADSAGSYLPVIGERCNHWQCVTSEGQRKSDAIKAMEEQGRQQSESAPVEGVTTEDAVPVPQSDEEDRKRFPN